jgi:hypothetical protein
MGKRKVWSFASLVGELTPGVPFEHAATTRHTSAADTRQARLRSIFG